MASLVLFDGVCNLCNGAVKFVIARDPHGRFRFGALQSAAARRAIEEHGAPDPLPDAIVLIEDGRLYTRSTAALRIARRLTFPWPLTACSWRYRVRSVTGSYARFAQPPLSLVRPSRHMHGADARIARAIHRVTLTLRNGVGYDNGLPQNRLATS